MQCKLCGTEINSGLGYGTDENKVICDYCFDNLVALEIEEGIVIHKEGDCNE